MRLVAGEPSGFGPLVFFYHQSIGCLSGSDLQVFRGILAEIISFLAVSAELHGMLALGFLEICQIRKRQISLFTNLVNLWNSCFGIWYDFAQFWVILYSVQYIQNFYGIPPTPYFAVTSSLRSKVPFVKSTLRFRYDTICFALNYNSAFITV